jgi:hypothetical protein
VTQHVEFVKFRVQDGRRAAFLAARPAAIAAVRAAHPLLVGAPVLAEHPDGSWTDVWIYQTAEAAAAANRQADRIPAFLAMAALLDDVTIDEATAPDETGALA